MIRTDNTVRHLLDKLNALVAENPDVLGWTVELQGCCQTGEWGSVVDPYPENRSIELLL